jgi:hypothetical protein
MELLGDVGHIRNLVSVHLEIELVSVQDRYTVRTKRTIGSKIDLDAPDGTPRVLGDDAQVEARFVLFGQSVDLDAR